MWIAAITAMASYKILQTQFRWVGQSDQSEPRQGDRTLESSFLRASAEFLSASAVRAQGLAGLARVYPRNFDVDAEAEVSPGSSAGRRSVRPISREDPLQPERRLQR